MKILEVFYKIEVGKSKRYVEESFGNNGIMRRQKNLRITWLSFFFQGIPESIALVTLAFVIAKARMDWKKVVVFGIILGISAFIIRRLPITFGVHLLVNIVLLLIFLNIVEKVKLITSIVSVVLTFVLLIVSETIIHVLCVNVFGLSMENILKDQVLYIIVGLPQILLIFLLSWVIKFFR